MKLNIGIDFDNTIACYDHVFTEVARTEKLLENSEKLSKAHLKRKVLADPSGDINWQRLQGQIYGKYMHMASAFPGFAEFLLLAKIRDHAIFVVSHKSEYGHFDENRVPLREEAMKWLVANRFVGEGKWMLSSDQVFFNTTRKDKIQRLSNLHCTHFIDDLPEVFEESSFPPDTIKYLFNGTPGLTSIAGVQHIASWRTLTREMLGEWVPDEIVIAAHAIFPELAVEKAILKKGRGNSRIYQLILHDGSRCALKIYPDRQTDQRERLETEFEICSILRKEGFPVMEPVAFNVNMNWAVYSWIDGDICTPGKEFVNEASDFLERLVKSAPTFKGFSQASEACFSGNEIVQQIRSRFSVLNKAETLGNFLEKEFRPQLEYHEQKARQLMGTAFDQALEISLQLASPSDFGAHNAIKKGRETVFIDFEYFGWDDPVKLVSDFHWHPAMDLSAPLKQQWLDKAGSIFKNDTGFAKRLTAYLPLFGLRWCLILLNEFLPERLAQRIHANQDKKLDTQLMLDRQLTKAKILLDQIKQIQ